MIDWFDLLVVQGILKSFLQHHSSKISFLWGSAFFRVQLSCLNMTTRKIIKKENSLAVQWLGLHAYTAGSQVPIPCWGTEIMKGRNTKHCILPPPKNALRKTMQTRAEGMIWKTGGDRFQRYKGNRAVGF